MRKSITKLPVIIICLSFIACRETKDSPSSITQKWCDLNGKAYKATKGPDKEAAVASLNQFENEMEARYKDDETFMKQVESEAEKCEGDSERK